VGVRDDGSESLFGSEDGCSLHTYVSPHCGTSAKRHSTRWISRVSAPRFRTRAPQSTPHASADRAARGRAVPNQSGARPPRTAPCLMFSRREIEQPSHTQCVPAAGSPMPPRRARQKCARTIYSRGGPPPPPPTGVRSARHLLEERLVGRLDGRRRHGTWRREANLLRRDAILFGRVGLRVG